MYTNGRCSIGMTRRSWQWVHWPERTSLSALCVSGLGGAARQPGCRSWGWTHQICSLCSAGIGSANYLYRKKIRVYWKPCFKVHDKAVIVSIPHLIQTFRRTGRKSGVRIEQRDAERGEYIYRLKPGWWPYAADGSCSHRVTWRGHEACGNGTLCGRQSWQMIGRLCCPSQRRAPESCRWLRSPSQRTQTLLDYKRQKILNSFCTPELSSVREKCNKNVIKCNKNGPWYLELLQASYAKWKKL